jgi:hypothetical protein
MNSLLQTLTPVLLHDEASQSQGMLFVLLLSGAAVATLLGPGVAC